MKKLVILLISLAAIPAAATTYVPYFKLDEGTSYLQVPLIREKVLRVNLNMFSRLSNIAHYVATKNNRPTEVGSAIATHHVANLGIALTHPMHWAINGLALAFVRDMIHTAANNGLKKDAPERVAKLTIVLGTEAFLYALHAYNTGQWQPFSIVSKEKASIKTNSKKDTNVTVNVTVQNTTAA